MRERYSENQSTKSRLIVISIIVLLLTACVAPYSAPVSDRAQPPSRKLDNPKIHRVGHGETLYSIAWRYGIDYRALAQRNHIARPYTIYPNQALKLDVGNAPAVQAPRTAATSSSAAKPKTTTVKPPSTVKPKPKVVKAPPTVARRSENKTPVKPKSTPPASSGAVPAWRWPTTGNVLSTFQGNNGLNKGVDIGGNLGQPVLAAASGQVVYAGSGLRGYGKLLIIKHNDIYLSAYAHNQNIRVQEKEMVKAGQRIADMGSSGTDRVKLHFEIRREGKPVDPMRYLPKR